MSGLVGVSSSMYRPVISNVLSPVIKDEVKFISSLEIVSRKVWALAETAIIVAIAGCRHGI